MAASRRTGPRARPDGGTNVLEDAREAELDRGPLQQWVSDSISHPERVYRAMFYVAAIFFLFTTLFPSTGCSWSR